MLGSIRKCKSYSNYVYTLSSIIIFNSIFKITIYLDILEVVWHFHSVTVVEQYVDF